MFHNSYFFFVQLYLFYWFHRIICFVSLYLLKVINPFWFFAQNIDFYCSFCPKVSYHILTSDRAPLGKFCESNYISESISEPLFHKLVLIWYPVEHGLVIIMFNFSLYCIFIVCSMFLQYTVYFFIQYFSFFFIHQWPSSNFSSVSIGICS